MKRSQQKITAVIQTYGNLYNKISDKHLKKPNKVQLRPQVNLLNPYNKFLSLSPPIKTTCMQMTT